MCFLRLHVNVESRLIIIIIIIENFSLHKEKKKRGKKRRNREIEIISTTHNRTIDTELKKNRGVGQNEAAGVIKKKERGEEKRKGEGEERGGLLPRGEFRKGIPPPFL